MIKIFDFFKKAYEKKIDASGLAVFRIFYGTILLFEVLHIFYFRHLIFDKIPFWEPSEIDFGLSLIVWIITIIFLILGLFTRQIAIINYFFSLTFIATIESYEYHMFYVYMGVNFLLIFTSVSKVGSLDALRLKLKYSNTRFNYKPPRKTSILNYHIFVLAAIAFVYFDSIFFKLVSYNWMNGLGMWLPGSIPHITHIENSFFLNIKWIAIGLGYLTLGFEAIFIFTFFKKNWRIPLLIIGLGLHFGILLQFPLPLFGLGVIAIYLLMVPVCCWPRIKSKILFKKPQLIFYYDEECPLCNRTKLILRHLDFFNAIEFKGVQTYGVNDERLKDKSQDMLLDNIFSITKKNKVLHGIDTYITSFKYIPLLFPVSLLLSIPGIYHIGKWLYKKVADNRYVERCTEENCGFTPPNFPINNDNMKITKKLKLSDIKIFSIGMGIIFLGILQLNVTYNSALINKLKRITGFQKTNIGKGTSVVSKIIKDQSKTFFGITSHPVFMDSHFKEYNHIIALQAILPNGKKIWLPIINKKGMPGPYNYSFNWVKWTFRINSPEINKVRLINGIRDFTAFWIHKNNFDLADIKFEIKVKKIKIPKKWEKNFLEKQILNPWINGGYAEWKNGEFYAEIRDIESL